MTFSTNSDHNLVYPTADGVVDTIAWERCREAVAEQWLQGIDAENADLDAVRTAIIQWILKLRK